MYQSFLFMRTAGKQILAIIFRAILDYPVMSDARLVGRRNWTKLPHTDLSQFNRLIVACACCFSEILFSSIRLVNF